MPKSRPSIVLAAFAAGGIISHTAFAAPDFEVPRFEIPDLNLRQFDLVPMIPVIPALPKDPCELDPESCRPGPPLMLAPILQVPQSDFCMQTDLQDPTQRQCWKQN